MNGESMGAVLVLNSRCLNEESEEASKLEARVECLQIEKLPREESLAKFD